MPRLIALWSAIFMRAWMYFQLSVTLVTCPVNFCYFRRYSDVTLDLEIYTVDSLKVFKGFFLRKSKLPVYYSSKRLD